MLVWEDLPYKFKLDAYLNAYRAYKAGAIECEPERPTLEKKPSTPNRANAEILAQAEEPNSNKILRLSPQIDLFNQPELTISINKSVAPILGIQMNEDGYLIITNKEDAKRTIQRTKNRLKKRSFDSDDGFPELMLRIVFEDELQGKDLQNPAYQQCRNKVINPENPSKVIQEDSITRFIENLKTNPDEFVPQALDSGSFGLHFNREFRNSSEEEALNMFVNYTNTLINIKLNNPQEFTNNETNNKLRKTKKQKKPRRYIAESRSVRKAWDNWFTK